MDEILEEKLNQTIKKIFPGQKYLNLCQYQKRKMIFSYLCNTVSYDYELLEKITENRLHRTKVSRNPREELLNAVLNNVGVCNAISQYYKLLLERVGIKSYCVICDDGTPVNHQLNLVYDSANGTYSFDDVTSVIFKRGSKKDFFDYDLKQALSKGQGTKRLLHFDEFFFLSEGYINHLIGRKESPFDTMSKLPSNIQSVRTDKELVF